ncbi:hypothetical protein HC928_25090 [bacterium]|nr:hypothetical protein [bacterium]
MIYETGNSQLGNQFIVADAHVHIHDCFNMEQLLCGALENFQHVTHRLLPFRQGGSQVDAANGNRAAFLFLTEIAGYNWFGKLSAIATSGDRAQEFSLQHWTLHPTEESVSVIARHTSHQLLYAIAGRQLVTQEGLEVLALITDSTFDDGMTLEETVYQISQAGAIPVLPWGFGKWLGGRGKVLKRFLEREDVPLFFLGDNSGRPVFWRRSPYFEMAEQKGLRVLPGTDPLPLASECSRPGSFGFIAEGRIDARTPAASIKQLLLDPRASVRAYGSLEMPFRFLRNQVAIRYGSR